jgi:hypothetical protein
LKRGISFELDGNQKNRNHKLTMPGVEGSGQRLQYLACAVLTVAEALSEQG